MSDSSRKTWNGNYIDICCNENPGFLSMTKNSTGDILSMEGAMVEMMDWISRSLKFEYRCQKEDQVFTKDFATNKTVWTSLYKMKQGLCEIAINPYVMNPERFNDYNFPTPFLETPNALVIPTPIITPLGISSVWKPFDSLVWISLLVFLSVTMILSSVDWYYSRKFHIENNISNDNIDLHWLFLFGLLMSKAGFKAPDKFRMRLVGGSWCIAALILTNYYTSGLTSLITASSPQPLVNSAEELANSSDINLVVVKGYGVAITIESGNSILMKKLDTKLKSKPDSMCSNATECLSKVIETGSSVFIHNSAGVMKLLSENLEKTGQCNFGIAKGTLGASIASWAIYKHSSNFELYQRGVLQMMATGHVDAWIDRYMPKPLQCLVNPDDRKQMLSAIRHPEYINLSNLISAFVCLAFGLALSIFTLLGEWLNRPRLSNLFS